MAAPEPALPEPVLAGGVTLVVAVVLVELVLLVVVTVAPPVVGTVSGGAPVVLVRLELLPPPQAARNRPAANAAIRATIRERLGIDRYLRTRAYRAAQWSTGSIR